jgi:hypothetical protein
MIIDVSFKVVNSDFDQEYADLYNWGEPGSDNWKYNKIDKYRIENVKSFSQNQYSSFKISGINENGEQEIIIINNVFHLCCELDDGNIEDYFVSKELIKSIHLTKESKGKGRFYFYLYDSIPFCTIYKTSYINLNDLPDSIKDSKLKNINLPNEVKSILIETSGLI